MSSTLVAASPTFEHISSIHLGSRYQKIVERDGYWYLAGEWGLECWQFNAQNEFVRLSEVATPGIAQWVALEGDHAYVADGWEGLTIVDVTNPHELRFVSNYEPPHRVGPENLCNVFCVSVKNGIAYASGFFGLSVIDVSDPYMPFQVDRIAFVDTVFGIPTDDGNIFGSSAILGDRLYIAVGSVATEDSATGLYELEISDPFHPEIVSLYTRNTGSPQFVQIQDSVLAVAANWSLHLFTISATGSLTPRDSLTDIIFHTGDVGDLTIQGNTVLLAGTGGTTQGGITNIDISNLDSIYIREDFSLPTNFNCVQMSDSIGFAGYFHSNLLKLRLKPDGFLDSTGFIGSNANVRGVAVKDDALYATSRNEGLIIFDVSDRANPVLLDRIPLGDPLRPIVLENYLCIGNIEPLAAIFDVSISTSPQVIDTIHRDRIWTFAKLDDVLFAPQLDSTYIYTLREGGLTYTGTEVSMSFREPIIRDSLAFGLGLICRIQSDTTLSLVSQIGGPGIDFDMKGGNYFAAQGYGGLGVFDVSNPSAPVFLKSWIRFGHSAQPGYAASVRILDEYALLFESEFSITVIDISNPGSPNPIGRLPTPGYALHGVLDSEYLYVADQYGVEIFRHSTVVDTDETEDPLPRQFVLEQNSPNPFHFKTKISFSLQQAQQAKLTIYNLLGQRVRQLSVQLLPAGAHEFWWDGRSDNGKEVASGVYFYELNTNVYRERKKMILLK